MNDVRAFVVLKLLLTIGYTMFLVPIPDAPTGVVIRFDNPTFDFSEGRNPTWLTVVRFEK